MTTRQAAAYRTERTGHTIVPKVLHDLRQMQLGPVVEKRGRLLKFRRDGLEAFLIEYGTEPRMWFVGSSAESIRSLRERGIRDWQSRGFCALSILIQLPDDDDVRA